MALKLKTAPAITPVSLAEAKARCRVDHTDDDALITRNIEIATSNLDGYHGILGRCLIQQTWELYYDEFPCDNLKIPLGNLISVDSIEYVDPTTLLYTTWAAANYEVDLVSVDGWVLAVDAWPTIAETSNAMRVTFKAGYGAAASDVPAAIRGAIEMLAASAYKNPEGVDYDQSFEGLPPAVQSLISPFRRVFV